MLAAVIYQIVPQAEVLAVREENPLVENIAQMLDDLGQFVAPCRGVFPWCGGENEHIIVLGQQVDSFDGAR